MMKLAALAPLAAAASALPAAPEENAGAGAALFPESRLITPAHAALLNSWAKEPAEQTWKLCYTTFTMSKTSPAEFHVGGRGACGCAADQRGISGSLWRETEMERQESRSVTVVALAHHLHRQSAY